MVEIVWTEPSLSDLEAIADYIALDNRSAAAELVTRVFRHVEQLSRHPESGSRPVEFKRTRYRQIVEPPCRIFHRFDGERIFVLHVTRHERVLRKGVLAVRWSKSER